MFIYLEASAQRTRRYMAIGLCMCVYLPSTMSHYVVMPEDSLFRHDEIMINSQETVKELVKFAIDETINTYSLQLDKFLPIDLSGLLRPRNKLTQRFGKILTYFLLSEHEKKTHPLAVHVPFSAGGCQLL